MDQTREKIFSKLLERRRKRLERSIFRKLLELAVLGSNQRRWFKKKKQKLAKRLRPDKRQLRKFKRLCGAAYPMYIRNPISKDALNERVLLLCLKWKKEPNRET